jgi:hypothetical protein
MTLRKSKSLLEKISEEALLKHLAAEAVPKTKSC